MITSPTPLLIPLSAQKTTQTCPSPLRKIMNCFLLPFDVRIRRKLKDSPGIFLPPVSKLFGREAPDHEVQTRHIYHHVVWSHRFGFVFTCHRDRRRVTGDSGNSGCRPTLLLSWCSIVP